MLICFYLAKIIHPASAILADECFKNKKNVIILIVNNSTHFFNKLK